jgi:ribose 5-phosphate isomerase RpiB
MRMFLGSEGKEEIKDAIIKMLEEFQLEAEDIIYFNVDRKSDYNDLIKELERATLSCIE